MGFESLSLMTMRTFTSDDIRREHDAAIASLNDQQRHSLWRQRHARQMMNFNGLSERQNLQVLFEQEAAERNAEARADEAEARALQANDNAEPGPKTAGAAGS